MDPRILDEVRDLTLKLLEVAGLDLSVEVEVLEGEVLLNLEGADVDLVLSENARLLHAINHLVSQAFFRRADRQYRFVVDCDNYRAQRTRELELLADKAAEKVSASHSPFRFQPMPASDRRVIHVHLADREQVETESDGRGQYRRVVVMPKDRSR